jgi:hypothetical protein
MQVRSDTHTERSKASQVDFESSELQLCLHEDTNRFFKRSEESTFEGSQAAARKMKKMALNVRNAVKYAVQKKGFLDPGECKYWSPSSGGAVVDLKFVDGGMYDNLGVLPLLRRGCSTVIVCVAASSNLTEIPKDKWRSNYNDVAALLGKFEPYLSPFLLKKGFKDTVNPRSKVFAGEEFEKLMEAMIDLQNDGKPLVVKMKLQLIPNELAGIYDKREVDMIFCFNGEVGSFEKNEFLGNQKLNNDFPYLSTMLTDYSVEDVNAPQLLQPRRTSEKHEV